MATEFKLPDLGENVDKADVLSVLVAEGDTIEEGQNVLELETDKASVELPCSVGGKVEKIHVREGDEVKVGQVILTLSGDAEAKSGDGGGNGDKAKAEPKPAGDRAASADKKSTDEESGDDESGDEDTEEEKIDKGKAPAGKEEETRIARELAAEDDGDAEEDEEPSASQKSRKDDKNKKGKKKRDKDRERETDEEPRRSVGDKKQADDRGADEQVTSSASPSARRYARQLGVDLSKVKATSPGGRISEDDLREHVRNRMGSGSGASAGGSTPLPDFNQWGDTEREPMKGIRRRTAQTVSNAWRTVPHVTQHDSADITDLEAGRKRFLEKAGKDAPKITMTVLAMKACAAALRKYPQVNASVDMEAEEIVYKDYIHIGIAVDTENGLIVPVVRDVDTKSAIELAEEVEELAAKARERKVKLEELQGASFTISNLGGIGGTGFTPIVNAPQVAILGISRAKMEPVWDGKEFKPRLMLPLSLSYDHRLVDGADAARFTRLVAELLSDPARMVLEV